MRANRNFGEEDPTISAVGGGLDGFNPGGDDFGVIRQVDGHDPYEIGREGANVHAPSAGDPQWDTPVGPAVDSTSQ